MTPKHFALLFIIVVSQAYFISCDDQEILLDEIAKQLGDDVSVKVSSHMEYLAANVISITTDATVEVKKDLRLDAKLNKADKIIGGIKAGYEKLTIEHNARSQAVIEKIKSDTAPTGGVENPFVKEFISMITVLEERLLKLVHIARDYLVDQLNLIAEDLKLHISGKVIAEKLENGLHIHHDIMLKEVVAMDLELLQKYHLVRHDLENVMVSSHALGYLDEKIHGMVFNSFDSYIKARGRVSKDIKTYAAIVLDTYGHH